MKLLLKICFFDIRAVLIVNGDGYCSSVVVLAVVVLVVVCVVVFVVDIIGE